MVRAFVFVRRIVRIGRRLLIPWPPIACVVRGVRGRSLGLLDYRVRVPLLLGVLGSSLCLLSVGIRFWRRCAWLVASVLLQD